ncbi:MAG TPA: zf-HC2 domain-containing protein, partial [Candidatus Deferrimicrobiaceae bacterium]
MECREVQERLSEFQDGTLPPGEAGSVAAHIRDCGECIRTARSLAAVREGLRSLPQLASPPELLAKVRAAVDRESVGAPPGTPGHAESPRGKSALSRLRVPLEAAAAVLLVASIWWYQKGAAPPPVPQAPSTPAGIAAPALPKAPGGAPRQSADAAKALGQEPRLARRSDGLPSTAAGPAETAPASAAPPARGKTEVASLPAGTPEPKPRAWSAADLP